MSVLPGAAPLSRLSRLTREALSDLAIAVDDPGEVRERPPRRVRHEVRDGVAVIVFSAVASTGVAVALLLLATLAG